MSSLGDDREGTFVFYGGGDSGSVHPSARIGGPPEDRSRDPEDPGFPPHIHATAIIEAYVTIDAGMRAHTTIGERTFLMKKVHVGHDATIGDDCDLAPMANVGGYAHIGNRVRIGMSAVILPYRVVGDGARVGAGAVVTKDVPPGVTVAGNPARFLDDAERDPRPHTERVAAIGVRTNSASANNIDWWNNYEPSRRSR